jgi:hypothetical protein
MRCNCCNSLHTKEAFCEANKKAIAASIKSTFSLVGNMLIRELANGEHKVVKQAKLYTLTGGRRVTHDMVMRVLNGESLYRQAKKK